MRWAFLAIGSLSFLQVSPSATWGAAGKQPPRASRRAAIAVWDTGQKAGDPLPPAVLAKKSGWTRIRAGKKAPPFKGDAVLSNGRVLVAVRQRGAAVDVYPGKALGAGGLRLHLRGPGGEPADRLQRVAVVENSKGAACLEVSYRTGKETAAQARFRLQKGDVSLQTEPGPGATHLAVECPTRYVVLPDFFADDIVIDPHHVPLDKVEVPSENFVAHLTGKGETLALCVFENRDQDVQITLAGKGKQRTITGSEIAFGKGGKIWVALLEAPHVWHTLSLKEADAGQVKRLDWKMPFPAQWRVDFTRTNGLTDSWEMLLALKEGQGYLKPSWLGGEADQVPRDRRRWNTVLGEYPYPCWSNRGGRGYLQPLGQVLHFRGPVVVYPINRVQATPVDAFTVVDVVRNTLGVGPCEYILDLEGQKSQYKGRATCSVREELKQIYGRRQQKQKRAEIEKILDDGLVFVKHIRGRITLYVDLGHKLRDYLAAQKKVHPELKDFITEMEQICGEIDDRVAALQSKIKTPAYVAAMNDKFRKEILNGDGKDEFARSRKYAEALVEIGGNQDELVGQCRWVVKRLRQRAGLRMALDARVAPIARELRARTQKALRNPSSHEGARH
jgi:hypothetical protein